MGKSGWILAERLVGGIKQNITRIKITALML